MTGPSDWINRHANRDPGRICIRLKGRVMTYGEVRSEIHAWAGWLVNDFGTEPGSVVWIAIASPLHQRLLRWAVDLIGGVEAVIDPRLAAPEAAARAQTLRPTVRIDSLPPVTPPAYLLTDRETPTQNSGRILFSSGTSGRARAALFDNARLTSAARSNIATRGLSGADTLLCALPSFHAAGSLFEDSMLLAGAALHLLEDAGAEALFDAIRSGHPTVTSLAPTRLRQLAHLSAGEPPWTHLRLINYAGEAIDEDTLRWLLRTFNGRVNRGYGTTEAGPLISVLGNGDHRSTFPDPRCLGQPAHGVRCRIDSDGILRVRSGHLMREYVNDRTATTDRLVDGWLVTGDLVDITDGRLMLHGRTGTAIRSGAEWVHPAEIERALENIKGVLESAVVAVASPTWGQRPVAFVSWSTPLAAAAVRERLEQQLAPFKWPDWVEPVAVLPRTGTTKVDRAALAKRAATGPSEQAIVIRTTENNTRNAKAQRRQGAE